MQAVIRQIVCLGLLEEGRPGPAAIRLVCGTARLHGAIARRVRAKHRQRRVARCLETLPERLPMPCGGHTAGANLKNHQLPALPRVRGHDDKRGLAFRELPVVVPDAHPQPVFADLLLRRDAVPAQRIRASKLCIYLKGKHIGIDDGDQVPEVDVDLAPDNRIDLLGHHKTDVLSRHPDSLV